MDGIENTTGPPGDNIGPYGNSFDTKQPPVDEPQVRGDETSTESLKLKNLDQEINKYIHWLQSTPLNHADRAPNLHTLGMRLIDKHHTVASLDPINSAIEFLQDALDISPLQTPTRGFRLVSLATAYKLKYERNANISNIDTAIQLCHQAVSITPLSHSLRSSRLRNLGDAYRLKYLRSGEIGDINEAIQQYSDGLDLELPNDIIRVDLIHSLGLAYQARYQETATLADLKSSNKLLEEACDLTAETDSAKNSRRKDVALGYQVKYLRTEQADDINKAIKLFQECIDHSSADDPLLATRYADIGVAYEAKHRKAAGIMNLEAAIRFLQDAVNLSGRNDPNYVWMLEELGKTYQTRFWETKVISDIDMSIQNWQRALDASPESFQHATQLQWLSRAASDKFKETNEVKDIDQSIQFMEKSLEKTFPGDLPRATRLFELGSRYRLKYGITRAKEDHATSIKHLRTVLDDVSFDVLVRTLAGKEAMSLFALSNDWRQGYDIAESLIKLIPLFIPRFLEPLDAQFVLRDIAGVACDAAAMALHAGKSPSVALQILEAGRDVMANSIEDLRGEVTSLKNKYPDVAEQFLTQRDALDKPIMDVNNSNQRYERGNVFGELIDHIRKLPGFEDFLHIPSEEALREAANAHPIVVINVGRYRSDAIIILHDCIRSMSLPGLSFEKVQQQPRHRTSISDPGVLFWLWEAAMKPILDSLGFTKMPISDEDWPRVSWIPTGPLSGFPLHAAGYHGNASSEAVIDRVMSSYSSSIKAVINGRHRNPTTTGLGSARSMLVSMENTPGATRLPFVTREIKMLHNLHASMSLDPIIAKDKKDIISQLPDCKIFHFAGHGFTDSQDPSRSHLLLEDKGKSDPLEVGTLLSMNLRQNLPFLAYLSACGTGQVKNDTFFDESIHLISAFRLAGFRHVIGTLWEVNDESCISMARITYEGIRDGGMTDASVCRGLHEAVRELRKSCLSMPGSGRGVHQRGEDEVREARHAAGDQDQQGSRRDVLPCDEDDVTLLHWVPYVHFGV